MIHRQVHFCLFNTGWKLPESSNSKICVLLQILGRRERNKCSSSSVCLSRYQQGWWGHWNVTTWELKRLLLEEVKGCWRLRSHETELGRWLSSKDVCRLTIRTWDCISAPLWKAGHGYTCAQNPNTMWGGDRRIPGGLLATSLAPGSGTDLTQRIKVDRSGH